jgi:hypothetical protein
LPPVVAILGVAVAGTLVLLFGLRQVQKPNAEPASPPRPVERLPAMSTPFIWPGIDRPPTRTAAESGLPDDAVVIGVSSAGKDRAYLVTAFSGPTRHVVNDLVGGVPVSVTHCDRTDCTRVFTDPDLDVPLPLATGGLIRDHLLLRTREGFYYQETGESTIPGNDKGFPFEDHPFVRTTWKAWREKHPDTDVYVGEAPKPEPGQEGGVR